MDAFYVSSSSMYIQANENLRQQLNVVRLSRHCTTEFKFLYLELEPL